MEKLISCCGLDCAVCNARIATINDDDNLRKATAEEWQKQFNAPFIDPKTINCTGCRIEGVKFSQCYQCEIRKCADNKGYITCAECSEMETCQLVGAVFGYTQEARLNLLSLKN